jgi:GNAT superfamily N-acetyltransferase
MEIRRYRRGEEDAIWQVYFAATRVSVARDYHAELIERWVPLNQDMKAWAERLAEKNPFVAVVEAQIVGMAWQGRGIGKALLERLEAEAGGVGSEDDLHAVQWGNYEHHDPRSEKQVTIAELVRFAQEFLKVDYVFWSMQEPFFSEQVVPYMEKRVEMLCSAL